MVNQRTINILVLLDGRINRCTGVGIINALGLSQIRHVLYCVAPTPHVAALYLAENHAISPATDDPAYLEWLVAHCTRYRIDVILPDGGDFALIARHREEILAASGARAIVQPDSVIAIAADKLLTSNWLCEQGLPHPRFAPVDDEDAVRALVEAVGLPLIAKPYNGECSHGVVRVERQQDLSDAMQRPDTLLQHYVGTDDCEYTANCFVTMDGSAPGTFVFRREIWNGVSIRCEVDRRQDVVDAAIAIATRLCARGSINIQFRLHEGVPVCLDVNPRLSGTTGMRAKLGFNDVEYTLRHYLFDEPLSELPVVEEGHAHRLFSEVYP